MHNVQLLLTYLERISTDNRLTPVHTALCLGLCKEWIKNDFDDTFRVSRRRLMWSAHIRSIATYHKVIKQLSAFGYISYLPSYHPTKASLITLLKHSVVLLK
jgi:hypothetical protein